MLNVAKISKMLKTLPVSLADFEFLRPLGNGGFSTVFLGKCLQIGTNIYVIKYLKYLTILTYA